MKTNGSAKQKFIKNVVSIGSIESGMGGGSEAHGDENDEPPLRNGNSCPASPNLHSLNPSSASDSSFPISSRCKEFRDRFFSTASDGEWSDWKWQLRNRIRDLPGLSRVFNLSSDEEETVRELGERLPVGITPYYASLIDVDNHADPLRKTMIPISSELITAPGEADDPLSEDADMPVPGLVHRYPDRVLFLLTSFCATYCRYCTRSRLVGKTGEYHFNRVQYERCLDYLRKTPSVRDVLFSGGDPLTMNDRNLDWILTEIRKIPHIEFVRIGSKIPAVMPQRITDSLCTMLRKHHPLWLSVHFMHPNEVTPEAKRACERLSDAGIPLGSQTVLTDGVNDSPDVMKKLMHELLKARVRPYYIYQCDPIPGSSHFRTSVERGLEIIEALRGHTTGYAVPTFVIDAPGGGGKIPISPNYIVGSDESGVKLRNYAGETFCYPPSAPRANGGN